MQRAVQCADTRAVDALTRRGLVSQIQVSRRRSLAVVPCLILFIAGSTLAPQAVADFWVGAQLTALCLLAPNVGSLDPARRSPRFRDGLSGTDTMEMSRPSVV
jgi:hypothetical protein